jgi:hypothetical protein
VSVLCGTANNVNKNQRLKKLQFPFSLFWIQPPRQTGEISQTAFFDPGFLEKWLRLAGQYSKGYLSSF